jgi:hypothetical protein
VTDPALLAALAPTSLHVGGLGTVGGDTSVPSWLTVLTGGVLVGASFLFSSLLTDHEAVREVNGLRAVVPTPEALRRGVAALLGAAGVATLLLVVASSAVGPPTPSSNFAILVVWAGWWAGYAMSTYLLGNSWPAVNPWRTLARLLPATGGRSLPEGYGAWPSVVALLGLVWVEVVSPVASEPRLLGGLVVAYTVVTLAGAHRYGVEAWFGTVDPVSRVFRLYGRVAPLRRTDDGLELRLPGTALTAAEPTAESGGTAFVVALLWVTTFDGLVATPTWNGFARPVVGAGVPAALLYPLALVVGYAVFLGAYRAAAVRSRARADSLVAPTTVERWFVAALLPIAAGYHVAHFSGYFLSLSPTLLSVLVRPLGGVGAPQAIVLPAWFGTLQLSFVVLGHLLAVWVAHSLALELFPGYLRPIRSQYPFVVVMMLYTMTSAWVIGQPFVTPAFL